MIKQELVDAINEQINAEYYSAYLYLSMSAYMTEQGLEGAANWMHVQYQEEVTHMMKFYNYLLERGGRVVLMAIEAPPVEWNSPLHVFEETLKHEEHVTSLINRLVDLSIEYRDHATTNFLQWYVAEQVEEEANANNILAKMKMVERSSDGIYMLDKELGQRVFVDSTQQN